MAVNKVIFNGATLVDMTDATVQPEYLSKGKTAYGASGAKVTGTLESGAEIQTTFTDAFSIPYADIVDIGTTLVNPVITVWENPTPEYINYEAQPPS